MPELSRPACLLVCVAASASAALTPRSAARPRTGPLKPAPPVAPGVVVWCPFPGNTQGNPSTETEEEVEERGLVSSIPASRIAGTQYPAPHAAPPSTCLRRFATSDATQLACLISGWLSLHVLYSFSRQRYNSGLANAQTSR